MSYQAYESYRDSGIEWLGEVPNGWKLKALRYLAEPITGLTYSPENIAEPDTGFLVLRASNIQNGKLDVDGQKNVFVDAVIPKKLHLVENDILVCSRNGSRNLIGKNALIKNPKPNWTYGAFNTVIRGGCNDFLYWVLNSSLFEFQSARFLTSTINQLTIGTFKSLIIPLPPSSEQASIVCFLNEKVGEIDTLIAKKEKLLELLAEKRTALITQAVTKGLDLAAPMKPSGIDWIGDIPQDWKKKKMSWFFRAEKGKNSQMFTKEYCGLNAGEFPVYSGQTGNDGIMGKIDTFEYDFGMEGCLFSTTVGAKAMTVDHLFSKFNLSQNCMIMTPTANVVLRYYYYFFTSLFGHERGLVSEHMQASFRVDDFYHYKILLPPYAEQERIAQFLDAELIEFDEVQKKIFRIIAKLKEYRTAIITNAVTGKIKVV